MHRIVPALIVLGVLVLPAEAFAAGPGTRERTFVRAPGSLRCREVSGGLPCLGGPPGIPARRRVPQWGRLLQPGECVLPGGGIRTVDRRVPQGQAIPPARSVSRGELAAALSVAPGRLPEPPPPWWSHVLFWSGWLSFPEKAYGAFAGFLLAALTACAALLLRRPRAYWVSAVLVIGAAVLSLDAGLTYADVASSRHGVVTQETIARKGIGKDYEPAFDQPLKDGAEFTVLSENGDWIFGHFEGIGDGWLRREHTVR